MPPVLSQVTVGAGGGGGLTAPPPPVPPPPPRPPTPPVVVPVTGETAEPKEPLLVAPKPDDLPVIGEIVPGAPAFDAPPPPPALLLSLLSFGLLELPVFWSPVLTV